MWNIEYLFQSASVSDSNKAIFKAEWGIDTESILSALKKTGEHCIDSLENGEELQALLTRRALI